jgi:hypothetical protein
MSQCRLFPRTIPKYLCPTLFPLSRPRLINVPSGHPATETLGFCGELHTAFQFVRNLAQNCHNAISSTPPFDVDDVEGEL